MKPTANVIRGWALIAAECREKAARVEVAVGIVRAVRVDSDVQHNVLALLRTEREQYDSMAREHEKLVRDALEGDA